MIITFENEDGSLEYVRLDPTDAPLEALRREKTGELTLLWQQTRLF